MAKVNINDYLDQLAEDIMNENTTENELEVLKTKSKQIIEIAKIKVKATEMNFKIAKAITNGDLNEKDIFNSKKLLE